MVYSPGTVIISASGEVTDVKKVVEPVIVNDASKPLYYIDFSSDKLALGGSALGQIINKIGQEAPTVTDAEYFIKVFNTIQDLIEEEQILAGHDVASGGLITTLLEMCFSDNESGLDLDLSGLGEKDSVMAFFNENPGIVIQAANASKLEATLTNAGVRFVKIGSPSAKRELTIKNFDLNYTLDIDSLRELWFKTSYLMDRKQSGEKLALERFKNYKNNQLDYDFKNFTRVKPPTTVST